MPRERLRAIARNLDLVVTGSSDHHGTGKTDHDLGCNTTPRRSTSACSSAPRSPPPAPGRTVPTVVPA